MATNTRLAGRGVRTLAANASERIQVFGSRKSFAVSNLSAAGSGLNIYIADDSGSPGTPALVAFPQQPVGMEADDTFFIVNPNGAAVTYVLGEVQFTGSGQPGGAGPGGGSGGGGGDGGQQAAGPAGGGDYAPPGRYLP